jgi:hypothetical protein
MKIGIIASHLIAGILLSKRDLIIEWTTELLISDKTKVASLLPGYKPDCGNTSGYLNKTEISYTVE